MKLAELVDQLEREATSAERFEATARVDVVLRSIIEDLQDVEADAPGANGAEPDQLIDVKEAAGILGVKVRYLYEHHDQFPFTRRLGRQLRFSKGASLGIWRGDGEFHAGREDQARVEGRDAETRWAFTGSKRRGRARIGW